jgi:5-methylcytosine-specific restriction endonuclease McrA
MAVMKPCLGCGALSTGSRCPTCTRSSYYQSSGWRTMARAFVAAAGGRCVRCGSDRYVSAHHVIARVEDGPDHPANLEPLCASCHAKEPR